MSDENVVINKLDNILENETKYDSDGVARGQSPARPISSSGSVGSAGSGGSSGTGSRGKRRTWKKPKDKPKRPLSAYNIFFKHERSRIVEGRADDPSPQEIVLSVEQILSTSRETRRHRKTHGRISFGDLARKIAEKWKTVDKERKAVFEHYAELDMRRYRKELKIWKDRKEQQALSGSMHEKLSNSACSLDAEDESELSLDQLGPSNHSRGGHYSSSDAWGARYSMNSSFSSIDSGESLEPIPINEMMRSSRASNHGSGSLSGSLSGSFPNMEVGVPAVPGVVPSNGFQQMNLSSPMRTMQNVPSVPSMPIQNMQPSEVALFNQQQQLLSNMQFGHLQQMPQPRQHMNAAAMNLQQQQLSLEEQRQQLIALQQQQQILQQQLIQQQNNLRMQQGNLVQQQASFAFAQQQQQGMAQPPVTMSQPSMTAHSLHDDTSNELLENFSSNLDLSRM